MKKFLTLALTLLAFVSLGQNNGTFKAVRFVNVTDSTTVSAINGTIYYNEQSDKFRVYQNGVWYDLLGTGGGTSVNFGSANQIPFVNSTADNFNYSTNFSFDPTNNFFVGGGGGSTADGSQTITWGDGNTNHGVFGSALFGELSTINATVGSGLSVGERNVLNGYGSKAFGRSCFTSTAAQFSLIGGWYSPTSVDPTVNLKTPRVTGASSFGWYETNASQVNNDGLNAASSAILGGLNPNIPSTSPRSVILGGNAIKARANDPNQVYVPNFNIIEIPASNDTASQILVRDFSTGEIETRSASTLGPAGNTNELQKNGGGVFAGTGVYSSTDGSMFLGQPGGGVAGDDRTIVSLASDGQNASLGIESTFLRLSTSNIVFNSNTDLSAYTGTFVYFPLGSAPSADPPSAEGYFQYSSGTGIPAFRLGNGSIIILSPQADLTAADNTDLSTELASFPQTLAVINNIRTRQQELRNIFVALGLITP